MTTRINQLSATDDLQTGDQVAVYSLVNGDTRKSSLKALKEFILDGVATPPGEGGGAGDHVHAIADVTGLQAALDGKEASGTAAATVAAHEASPDPHPQYLEAADIVNKADLVGGKVPSAQLPAFVDDVIEAANFAALPGSGESGKIYVTLDSNLTYRWSGSAYVEISASPGSTDVVTEGAINKYFTEARVRSSLLTGLSLATNAAITAADSVLSALGKLQKQITDALTSIAAKMTNPMTAVGDIIIGGASGTPTALPAGTNGHVLTLASGSPAWAAPGGGDMLSALLSSEVSITGATTLTSAAFGKMHVCSGTTADYTVGFPAASGNAGKFIGIRGAAGLTKVVTLDGNASELIAGSLTQLKTAGRSSIYLCDGSNYYEVANGDWLVSSFSANKNGVTQAISANTVTKVTFTNEVFDTVGDYDAANSKYTPSQPGLYLFSVCIFNTGSADANALQLRLYKNGVQVANGASAHASYVGALGVSASFLLQANGTDYFEVYSYSSPGATTIEGFVGTTSFSGIKVG